jgi:hypothetical protein
MHIRDIKSLWRNVSAGRGTRVPMAAGLDAFLSQMQPAALDRLTNALLLSAKGSERPGDLETVGWASACTYDLMPGKVREAGIACQPHQLFEAGLVLMDEGWTVSERLMALKDSPDDIARLKALLRTPDKEVIYPEGVFNDGREAGHEQNDGLQVAGHDAHADVGFDLFENSKPPMESTRSAAAPLDQAHRAADNAEESTAQPWLKLRLFGQTAAHTLEISQHRRASNFLGTSVVSIESARSTTKGGFDWENKLSIQLTPEEMPEVIAVLLGIVQEATFSNHGVDRNKSVSFRNQKDGIQMVTSLRNTNYAVPVKTSVVYYLLDLFCRAMTEGSPGRSTADVIATVRGVYS